MVKDTDPALMSIFLAASGNAQAGKGDAIVKVLNGLQRACDLINEHPERAAEIIIGVYGRTWNIESQVNVFKKSVWGIDLADGDVNALNRASELINGAGKESKGALPTGAGITSRMTDLFMSTAGLPKAEFVTAQAAYGIDTGRTWKA
jgi:ABC-type nitrate/sulfonate/bicarbonate transport system substrate-binding protein